MCQEDATWWQARYDGDANPRAGLVPSKQFQERRFAQQRPATPPQPPKAPTRRMSGFRRSFRLSRRSRKTNKSMYECKKSDIYDTADTDIHNNKLVEYGEYKGNYYGTSLDAVRAVLSRNKVCLLDVQPHTLKHLRTAEFKPFVVFVSPPSLERLRATRSNGKVISSKDDHGAAKPFTEEDFEEMVKTAQVMEGQYGHLFEKVIVNEDLTAAFGELRQALRQVENEKHWLPVSWTHS
ncbi:hypothetical protein CRUP_017343 [Coryphaenoides rupestris]|nr:hypothetical protein CRUP_017343 [Coryphaenoides rupestris]